MDKNVFKFLCDSNGNQGLTYNEISDFLEIDVRKINNIRKRVLRKLKKDERII